MNLRRRPLRIRKFKMSERCGTKRNGPTLNLIAIRDESCAISKEIEFIKKLFPFEDIEHGTHESLSRSLPNSSLESIKKHKTPSLLLLKPNLLKPILLKPVLFKPIKGSLN